MTDQKTQPEAALQDSTFKRAIGPWTLALYGLGTVVGAGIYVVIGKIIGMSGVFAPLAFLVAAIAAGLTALSYAELSIRIPESGGSAAFVSAGLRSRILTAMAGWAIVATGITSAATVTTGVVGYSKVFFTIADGTAILALVGTLTLIAAIGIRQTGWFMALTTIAGVLGLIWVIGYGWDDLHRYPSLVNEAWSEKGGRISSIILPAGFLAFYAYIGFEDLVTLSEEAQDQPSAMPRAIWFTLIVSLALYLAVSITAVSTLSPERLAASSAPLVDVVREKGGTGYFLGGVSLLMIINGAMAHIVMVPRVLHDLAQHRRSAPIWLAKVNRNTGTPVLATVLAGVAVALLALFFPTEMLAAWTSYILLAVFIAANLSLIAIKLRATERTTRFEVPLVVPIAGATVSLGLMVGEIIL